MSARVTISLVSLCLALAIGCAGSRGVPIHNPEPIAAAATPETTEQVILDTLPRRQWTAEEVTPGRIVAFLPVKTYLVRAEIVYTPQQIQIAYLNSDNLGAHQEADGQTYAHGNVNKWMRKLAADLTKAVAIQARVVVPAPVAEPAPAPAATEPQPAAAAQP